MNLRYLLLSIALMGSSCSTDSLLIEQYTPKFSANPFLADGYCQDIWGRMNDENSATVFTGRYGLLTEDDFQTYHYNIFGDFENGIPCFGETLFFDGSNVWTLYSAGALSWKLSLGTTTASEAKTIESYDLRIKHESLASFNIQPPTVLSLNTMIFTAYRDGVLRICSLIEDEVEILAEIVTTLIPNKIFYSNNKFFLLANKNYVFISTNGIDWSDPVLITNNSESIFSIKERQNLIIAMSTDNIYASSFNVGEWHQITPALPGTIQDIELINENILYAVIGQQEDPSFGWISKLAKSTDGGSNWQLIDGQFMARGYHFSMSSMELQCPKVFCKVLMTVVLTGN